MTVAYWPALSCNFVQFDDPDYVTSNPHIQHGLNWPMVAWAFRSGYASNWHPLTWLSHALDVQLYGLNPAGHHATSILWHLANSILLFLVLRRLTGARWRSSVVAALFALHPMHVESVAWVSERKDVISTFFWLLTVAAYARYVENLKNQNANFKFHYIAALFFFALGLMAKPMLVTLPFVLLLLDYWPLGRLTGASNKNLVRLLLEKTPFLLLAIASSVITFLVQRDAGVMSSLTKITLGARLDNLPVAYERYLLNTFWPLHLAAFYGHPRFWPLWRFVTSVVLLTGITAWVVILRKRKPYLMVGWFWFLGMLVPVIGLVQVGNQSMADRYGYMPIVGIFMMAVWGAGEWLAGSPGGRRFAAVSAILVIGGCAVLTARQAGVWENTITLFVHASEVTADNYDAFYNLGRYWQHKGDNARAADYYQKSLKIKPDYALAHNNLGYIYLQEGNAGAAITNFEAALDSQPVYPEACYNLGRAFLTNALPAQAAAFFKKAQDLDPNVAAIHFSLGESLQRQGLVSAAVSEYQRALELRPDLVPACNSLAWLLATCPEASFRDGPLGVALAQHAAKLTGNLEPLVLETLAAAQAEVKNFPEAIATAGRARQVAAAQTNTALVKIIDAQEEQYGKSLPWRDTNQLVKDGRGR